ncbi:MAG: hypothetical protein U5K37_09935 [Natrialbaceae archaeon]|nr:hypothetical protein [Natrialbaceae archaeon]
MDWLTIDRKARLAGCLTAAAALTLGMAVPLFVGPDVLTALLVFAVLTVVPFLAIEGVHTLRRTLGGTG